MSKLKVLSLAVLVVVSLSACRARAADDIVCPPGSYPMDSDGDGKVDICIIEKERVSRFG